MDTIGGQLVPTLAKLSQRRYRIMDDVSGDGVSSEQRLFEFLRVRGLKFLSLLCRWIESCIDGASHGLFTIL